METNYDVNYFIKKFEAIPEIMWCVYTPIGANNTFCAVGHCGERSIWTGSRTTEGIALRDIVQKHLSVHITDINDNEVRAYKQAHPKKRVLAALYDIKAMQDKVGKPKEKIIYKTVYIAEKLKELELVSYTN